MNHSYPFDPTYGYSPAQLRAIAPPPEPPDFDRFWQATYAATLATPLALEVREAPSASAAHRLREVFFDTLDGVRVGAWLVEPRGGPVTHGAVVGHGYGGREGPEYATRAAAFLYVCAPGFALSAHRDIPGASDTHVLHGITHRETYILRHCVASIWTAARVLADLASAAAESLLYVGGSFGGGLGALALPWEPRYRRAQLEVPTFGHHPLRLTMPCVGSGEAVRRHVRQHPEATTVLGYYDAASAARRIRIPVLAVPAVFDPAVPPPGQFAVCNALAGPVERVELSAGHFDYPASAAESRALAQCAETFLWRPVLRRDAGGVLADTGRDVD